MNDDLTIITDGELVSGLPIAFDSGQKSPCRGCEFEDEIKTKHEKCINCEDIESWQDKEFEASGKIYKTHKAKKGISKKPDRRGRPKKNIAKRKHGIPGRPTNKTEWSCLTRLDLSNFPDLANKIWDDSKKELRSIPAQIIYILKKYYE